MNPIIAQVLIANATDIEAIIAKVGIGTLLSLMPHILAILETVEKARK
jgi:hypothetical protein